MFRAYIKDKLDITASPKAFVDVVSFTIRRDLLTSVNSSFYLIEVTSNINEGDLFVLYDDKGKVYYQGIICAINTGEIQCNQIQAFYKGLWIYDTYPTSSLEGEIAHILSDYSQGYLKGCSWQDTLIAQEKSPITITTSSSTSQQLESGEETKDFEKFIYELYDKYNIVFDFNIPYSNAGSVDIRKASSSIVKIGNNTDSIVEISPTTEIEEINKLVVFAKDGTYRTTFVYTTTNGIVEEPNTIAGRFGIVNTKVVKSDDDINIIKDANISSSMFNHQVNFTMLLDNKLYNFWDWELGQQMQIYQNGKYFESVFTGYELSCAENQEPREVQITCGKVRTKLTSLLKLGIAR